MRTYSELQALCKAAMRKIMQDTPDVGAVMITWNRGQKKTPCAIFTHANGDERAVVMFLLRSAADNIDTTETLEKQGMMVTPSGLVVPADKKSKIVMPTLNKDN